MNAITELTASTRHKLTYDEVRALIVGGQLPRDRKYELIDGVLYQMPAESVPHVSAKTAIITNLIRSLPDAYVTVPDSTLNLSEINAPNPDLYVYPAQMALEALRGEDVLLVVEIAVSSLADDLGAKAALYAAHGVREYWVVDVDGRETHVFRQPGEHGWASSTVAAFEPPISIEAIPDFSLVVADLPQL